MRQLADLRSLIEENEDVALLAISIDKLDKSKVLVERVEKDGKGKLDYPLVSDPDHKTIDEFGLIDTRYIGRGIEGVPQTAIYILDKNRKVLWANVSADYVNRPSVAQLRTEIDKFKKMSGSDKTMKKEKMDKKEHMKKSSSDKMIKKEKMDMKEHMEKSDKDNI